MTNTEAPATLTARATAAAAHLNSRGYAARVETTGRDLIVVVSDLDTAPERDAVSLVGDLQGMHFGPIRTIPRDGDLTEVSIRFI